MNNSRTVNSVRNTFFAALSYLVKTLLAFFVRAVFVRYIAVEYLGLNGLFSNILNVLSLAELGIGNAIVYSMYKPIADGDTEKIGAFVRLYKKVYWVIGLVISVVGLCLIPVLPYLVKGAAGVDVNLTVVYLLYLVQSVVGYFFAYRRALIFAYQRNDVESKVNLVSTILMSVAQIVVIVVLHNYYAYVIAMICAVVLDSAVVFALSYKMFPGIREKRVGIDRAEKKTIVKNTGALVFHKLGYAAVFSSDSIIISAFVGAAALGVYSNYTLVTSALLSLINIFVTAVRSSVGNLIITKTKEEVYRIFKALNMVHMWIVGFCAIGLICCFQDFIVVLTSDSKFLMPFSTVLLVCVSFFLTASRRMTDSFKESAGLFWNDRFKPLFEAGINLGLDLLLVHFWGINGVILATIVSTVTVTLWVEPLVLFRHYFKKSPWLYYLRYLVLTAIFCAVCGITYGICFVIPGVGWTSFLLKVAVCLVVPNALLLLCAFKTPEFGYLWGICKSLLKKDRGGKPDEK